jgi:hypothetical protein
MDDIQSGEIWCADLSGRPRDSVVNVSQVLTLDRSFLTEHAGTLSARLQEFSGCGIAIRPATLALLLPPQALNVCDHAPQYVRLGLAGERRRLGLVSALFKRFRSW